MRKKKLLSILLALAMLLSLMPTVALAEDVEPAAHTHSFINGLCACGACDGGHGEGWSALNQDNIENNRTLCGSYYLSTDVTFTGSVTINGTVNLCLNGHVIQDGTIYVPVSATLNLYDCDTKTVHYFTEGENGLWVYQTSSSEAKHTIYGGVITGSNRKVNNYGTFTMNGGTIVGSAPDNGGGVYNDGVFTMTGGTIAGCTANTGGGVYNWSTFTMTGGTIEGCTATYSSGGVRNSGTFTMTGGTIEGCTADKKGGGICNSGTLNLGGTAKVEGNTTTDNTTNNVQNEDGIVIKLGTGTGEDGNGVPVPTQGMHVGVTGSGAFTNATAKEEYLPYFFVDSDAQHIGIKDGKFLCCNNTNLNKMDAKPATCTALGINTAYWQCNTCGNYYSDEAGKNRLDAATVAGYMIPVSPTHHSFTGNAVPNNNGTHSRACVNGCGEYGGVEDCTYNENDICIYCGGPLLHKHNDVAFTAWGNNASEITSLPDTAGSYYLTRDVTISSTWNVPKGETNLCLNGHKLKLQLDEYSKDSVIYISGNATLNLHDCKDGTISGGNAYNGGGVCNDGVFTMTGGTIAGCTANTGGGVYNWGTFTMTGGSITGNTANGEYGGGIFNSGTLTLGGTAKVEGNMCNGVSNNLQLDWYNQIALGDGSDIPAPAEGMHIGVTGSEGTFTNEAADQSYLDNGYFFADDDIHWGIEFDSSDNTFCLVKLPHIHTNLEGDEIRFEEASALPELNRDEQYNLYLVNDISLANPWTIPEGCTVNLCLNGHMISYNDGKVGSVIEVSQGATLSLYDCDTSVAHYFEGSKATYVVTGGIITGGTGSHYDNNDDYRAGGGVLVYPGGTFTMNGGSIIDCAAKLEAGSSEGGGVYNAGTFIMAAGTIGGCTARQGGAVYNSGEFYMIGGTIESCAAEENGGGVYNWGTFIMNGGTIEGCAAGNGGGIYSNSTIGLGGTAKVEGNQSGDVPNNVQFNDWEGGITFATDVEDDYGSVAAPEEGMHIGVTGDDGAFTDATAKEEYLPYFFADSATKHVDFVDGALSLSSLTEVEAKPATCIEPGISTTYWVCDICGNYFSDTAIKSPIDADTVASYVIPASPAFHNLTKVTVKPATCTTPGVKTAYWQCNTCGNYYSDEAGKNPLDAATVQSYYVIEALGHSFKGKAVPNNDGTHSRACVNGCGEYGEAEKCTFDDDGVCTTCGWILLHKHNDVDFAVWNKADSLPDTAGSYYLTRDVTIGSTWTVPTGATNLCLNGHKLQLAKGSEGSVVLVPEGATLNLYDCKDGTISGGKAEVGGGIYNEGTLTMAGITIADCDATEEGGGVYNEGTLTMTDSTISGCTAEVGGGIFNYRTFTMTGCTITDCEATEEGGGIYNYRTFSMSGGTITACTAEAGGGVFNYRGDFTMSGGTITGCKATEEGGGVYNYRTFNMDDASTISGCTADSGAGVYNYHTLTMNGESSISCCVASTNGGGIYNGAVLTFGGSVVVDNNTLADNTKNNLCNRSTKVITLGTSTDGTDGNSVLKPTQNMHIGVSGEVDVFFSDETADRDYLNRGNFFADSDSQYVVYKENKLWLCEALKFDGAYLTIENDISVNFVVEKEKCKVESDEPGGYTYVAPTVTYTVDGKSKGEVACTTDGKYYVFCLDSLNPAQIDSLIVATLNWNGQVSSKSYSIKEYCYNKLNDTTQKSDKFKNLLVDLLNYGAETQKYLGKTTNLCNASLSDAQKARATQKPDLSKEAVQDIADPNVEATVTWGGRTLVLGSTVAIRCYIKEDATGLTGKVLNGPNNVLQTAPLTYDKVKNQYYVEYAGLPAANMRDYPAFALYDGDGSLVSSYQLYNPAAYAAEVVNDTENKYAKEKPLVTAMMIYGDAANAYWTEKYTNQEVE